MQALLKGHAGLPHSPFLTADISPSGRLHKHFRTMQMETRHSTKYRHMDHSFLSATRSLVAIRVSEDYVHARMCQ